MRFTTSQFETAAAGFLRDIVVGLVRRELAALRTDPAARGLADLIARVAAWTDDIEAGRDAAALEPERFALMIETMWLLSVAGVDPNPDKDGGAMHLFLRPELTRAVELTAVAADALDLLRGTAVAAEWRARRIDLAYMIADRAADPMAGCAGTA